MIDKVIAIYITDDIFRAIGHPEDCRRYLSDAEALTTSFVAALFFGGKQTYLVR